MMDRTPERIREGRKKISLTQEQLGKKVHVTKQSVSKWETGENLPESPIMNALADLFGFTVDYLYGRTNDSGTVNNVNEHILEVMIDIPPKDRDEGLREFFVKFGYIKNHNDLSPDHISFLQNMIKRFIYLVK